MTRLTQLCTSTILTTFLIGSAALADVSPLDVWDDWQELLERADTTASFDQSISDGILTINNLTLTGQDQDGDDFQIKLGSLVFQDQGDGSVAVLLPNDAPIVLITGTEKLTLNQSHRDLSLVISGSDNDLTYSYSAADLALKVVELITDGEKTNGINADLTLTGLNGTTHSQGTHLRKISQDIRIKSMAYSMDFALDTLEEKGTSSGAITDLHSRFNLTLPENLKTATIDAIFAAGFIIAGDISYGDLSSHMTFHDDDEAVDISLTSKAGKITTAVEQGRKTLMDVSQSVSFGPTTMHIDVDRLNGNEAVLVDLALNQIGGDFTIAFPDIFDTDNDVEASFTEALEAGLKLAARFGYTGVNGSFSFHEGDKSASGTLTSASADLDLALDRQAVRYSTRSLDIDITAETSELPIGPIKVSASELSNTFEIPLNVTTDPTPFSYHDRYINLIISENLWAMFDPEKMLPRGAATYILDLAGTGNWLVDPFDEDLQRGRHKGPKGELHSLDLNELQLNVAGVDLTGTGSFTFNNDDLETFGGVPAPIGALDLKLIGFNQMLDTLIELGLLPKDQAMGARMGLGLFTIAGDGEDTLISHIETTTDGKVLANGKRLK